MAVGKSLLRMWQTRFKSQVAAYRKVYAELEAKRKDMNDNGPDNADIADLQALERREVYLRGVVRGAAQVLIILTRPYAYKDKDEIVKLERDYGMPGERGYNPTGTRNAHEFFEDQWSTFDQSDWGDAMHRDGHTLQARRSRW